MLAFLPLLDASTLTLFHKRTQLSLAMSPTLARRMDCAQVLMSDGWVHRLAADAASNTTISTTRPRSSSRARRTRRAFSLSSVSVAASSPPHASPARSRLARMRRRGGWCRNFLLVMSCAMDLWCVCTCACTYGSHGAGAGVWLGEARGAWRRRCGELPLGAGPA